MVERVNKMAVLRNAMEGEAEDRAVVRDMVSNASLLRSNLLSKLIDSRRDIDDECGYPKDITSAQYKMMFDREGIANRVVTIYPEETWGRDPEVFENESPDETEFEKAFKKVEKEFQLWSYLAKIDEISGIGRFGVLLLGIDDGKDLKEPVEGIDPKGKKVGNAQHKLLYLRVFDESLVTVKEVEKDRTNPRFGKPLSYSVTFDSITYTRTTDGQIIDTASQEQVVHWTRIIHIADNRRSSEVYGTPRMQVLFNRLYDLRKIAGGSGEMFWKGGFPGYSFEMAPDAKPLTTDELDTLRETVADYANGLQRYLTLQGITTKSILSQVADPKSHIEVQLEIIAIAIGVPQRIFMGSEQAKLASTTDSATWNKRINRRQTKYVTPYIIRPTVDRLIAFGVLPEVADYDVDWPDLESPSDLDKAEVLAKMAEAFAKYVAGGVDMLIPPEQFLIMFAGLTTEQVKEISKAAVEHQDDVDEGMEEELQKMPPAPAPGQNPKEKPGQPAPIPKPRPKVVKGE